MQVPYLGMSLTEQLTIAYHKDMQQYHNTVHKTICLSKQKREWKKRKRKNCSLICCIMVFCGLLLFNFNKCVTWVIYLSHSLFLMLMLPWLISPTKRSHKIVTLVSQTVWDSIWNRGLSKKNIAILVPVFLYRLVSQERVTCDIAISTARPTRHSFIFYKTGMVQILLLKIERKAKSQMHFKKKMKYPTALTVKHFNLQSMSFKAQFTSCWIYAMTVNESIKHILKMYCLPKNVLLVLTALQKLCSLCLGK